MSRVKFPPYFKRRLKALAKRYRSIKKDIQPIIDELEKGNLVGDQIPGLSIAAFKVRARNSDIPIGKRGGYRLIYKVETLESLDCIFLVTIYAKSDQTDISAKEIEEVAQAIIEE